MERFKAQPDTFLGYYSERRKAVQKGIELLKNAPDSPVIGATLFGSTSKGTAKWRSDIDVCIFYNSEIVSGIGEIDEIELIRPTTYEELQKAKEGIDFPANNVATFFQQKGKEAISLYLSRTQNIFVKKLEVFPIPLSKFVVEDSCLALERKPSVQTLEQATMRMARLFHMAITDGVREYRRLLLQICDSEEVNGQMIWGQVIDQVVSQEQFLKWRQWSKTGKDPIREFLDDIKLHYPYELDEAIKVYTQ